MAAEFDFDFDKLVAAVTFLASERLPELSKGKICKLLFLADRAHVVRYGRPIIGDRHCALEQGPILSATLNALNAVEKSLKEGVTPSDPGIAELTKHLKLDTSFTHPHYSAERAVEMEALSKSDAMILADIAARYGQNTFAELRRITHDFAAYKKAWSGRCGDAADMRFEDLFDDDDADDIVEGAKEEMVENARLREAMTEYVY